MMCKKVRFLGVSAVAAVAVAAGATVYMAPSLAISTPSQAAAIADSHEDPAPQRFQLAQAPSDGQPADGVPASGLPGGATSLNETYADWVVACQVANNAKRCVMSQQQNQQNGQRVLALELNAPSGNTVSGTLVLPFGLALDPGVTFQIDDKPAMQPLRFRTCVPAGCLVPVTFDAPTLVVLRAAAALKIKAVADGGTAAPFAIPLQGLSTALDRLEALSR